MNMKRLVSVLLIYTMALSFFPIFSLAEETDADAMQQKAMSETGNLASNEVVAVTTEVPIEEMATEEVAENEGVLISPSNDACFYIGKGYSFVVADLMHTGFNTIQVQEITDFHPDLRNGEVVSVSIAEDKSFQTGMQINANAAVVVEYYRQTMALLPLTSVDLVDAEYPMLLASLYEAGFRNIEVDEQYDLESSASLGKPTISMTVDGEAFFQNEVPLPVEIPITLIAHFQQESEYCIVDDGKEKRTENSIVLPFSSEYYMRKNQKDCVQEFMQLGFKNVESCAVTDMLWGSTQPGQVVGVSVNDTQMFQHGNCFDSDAKVIVYYHVPEFRFLESEFKAAEGNTLTIPYYVGAGDDFTDVTITVENKSVLRQTAPYSFSSLTAGTTTISAYCLGTPLAECSVIVEPIPIEKITLSEEKISVGVGRTWNVSFTVLPNNATCTQVSVTSANPKIVVAELQQGDENIVRITGVKAGKAMITIQASDKVIAKKQINVVDVVPEEISIAVDTGDVFVGATGMLSAAFVPSDVTNQKVTWKSSAPKVLKVNRDGSYQALAAGETTVTATHTNGLLVTKEITVRPVLAKSLNLRSDWNGAKPFYRNNTMNLTAEILPENTTDKEITWTSSNKTIATVSPKGVVKAIAAGNTIITATTSNGVKKTYPVCVAVSPQTFRVTASIRMVSNDHVGNKWSTGFEFNRTPLRSGSTVSVNPGETFSAGGWAEDSDSRPDYGQYSETIELTNDMCKNGFTIEGDVVVVENSGRYRGNCAVWHLKMQFTPVN